MRVVGRVYVQGINPGKGGEDRKVAAAGAERDTAMGMRDSPIPAFLSAKPKRCPLHAACPIAKASPRGPSRILQ